ATCLFQPTSGSVLYDGKHYQEYTRNTLNRSIALVDQIVQLFPGTIRENLTLWNPQIPDEEIIKAAKIACIDEEIVCLADGYYSQVAEDGNNFSGGQRQRLEIARAILKKPTFLILDEATNSLDAITEANLLANIRSLGISTILISHRLNIFKNCDRILVFEEGAIAQDGTHEQLSKIEGLYKKLLEFEIQKKL
ncbi:MAG: hypothetical protein K1000chlam2_00843, partial [Chlamydiae bacterium]|nr:hypothetical protein [Chlamydiota bacterium]